MPPLRIVAFIKELCALAAGRIAVSGSHAEIISACYALDARPVLYGFTKKLASLNTVQALTRLIFYKCTVLPPAAHHITVRVSVKRKATV